MTLRVIMAAVAATLVTVQAGAAYAQARNQPTGVGPAGLPPADQPLIEEIPKPAPITVDGGMGALGYLSGAAAPGFAWNVRVTGNLTPRWAVEGNYVGSVNQRTGIVDTSLVYTSFDAGVRFNILEADKAPFQPYVTGGIGYVGYIGNEGDGAALVLPVSAGVERQITSNIKGGARVGLRPSFFDELGVGRRRAAVGGDAWNVIVNLGGAF